MSRREEEVAAIGDERNGAAGEDDFEVLAGKAEEAAEAEAMAEAESAGEPSPVMAVADDGPTNDTTALDDWDDDAALMLDLADAMHTAATARHTRALELVERRRAAHVQAIRERAEEEAATAQAQAERDVTSIVEWAESEISRIQAEKVRRGEARERELDALLDRHRAQIEWEIEAVEDAVQAHRANLDSFYTRLSTEPDAGTIARLATEAPQLPDLESISLSARARSVAAGGAPAPASHREEPAAVAVMDEPYAAAGSASTDTADASDSVEIDIEAPSMLDLSDVSEPVEAEAEPDAELVGVMAPEAMTEEPGVSPELSGLAKEPEEAFAGAYIAPDSKTQGGESADLIGAAEEPEKVPAASGATGTLLQAISVLRPTASWWNHGQNEPKD